MTEKFLLALLVAVLGVSGCAPFNYVAIDKPVALKTVSRIVPDLVVGSSVDSLLGVFGPMA